jgi:glutathione-regulated potassium-efflux system ancillary protein KefC/glutathione-regulated potassium-efflux system protein KefB
VFRFIAASRGREVFTAAALLIVVGVTVLMETVGLSPALGAFLAGMVLGDSEYRRELESDIEPFRGLFLGLFFITIGAGVDLSAVAGAPLQIVGLTAGLMLLKGVVLFTLVRAFGAAWRDAGAVGVALCQGGEFAFVLFAFALGAGLLEPALVARLTVVVALSMALTPLLIIAYDRAVLASAAAAPEPEAEAFPDAPPDVIIAGYGRFGQVVGRALTASGFRTTILESSAAQIELVRRFGRRAYYGDASRLDLLRAAGADKARVLVVAIDDREKAAELVELARAEFPNLVVVARAWDRRHAYLLQARGAHVVERETFEGALSLARESLKQLGLGPLRAQRAVQIFRRHDRRLFEELAPLWEDEARFVVASRESSRVMDKLLAEDLQALRVRPDDDGWDTEALYRELRGEDVDEPPQAQAEDRAAT